MSEDLKKEETTTKADIKISNDISTKLVEITKSIQDANDKLEEKCDGLVKSHLVGLTEKLSELSVQVSDEKVERMNQEKIFKQQFALVSGMNAGENGKQVNPEIHKGFRRFLTQERGYLDYEEIMPEVIKGVVSGKAFVHNSDDYLEKTLAVGNNPTAGFLVPHEFGGVIDARIFESSPMRAVANVTTTSNESVHLVIDDDETDAKWVGELEPPSDSKSPTFGETIIHTHEMSAQPVVTTKQLEDAGFDLEDTLIKKISDAMTRKEATAFVAGTGSKRPRGFLTYPNWSAPGEYTRGAIEQIDSGVLGEVSADSLKDLQNSLIQDHQSSAVWMMQRQTWSEIAKIKGSDGHYLLDPLASFRQGDDLLLLGKRVILADDMPAAANDSLAVAYGDFGKSYTIVDRLGITIMRDVLTQKPLILFYTRKRVGGDVTNYQALKLLKLTA